MRRGGTSEDWGCPAELAGWKEWGTRTRHGRYGLGELSGECYLACAVSA